MKVQEAAYNAKTEELKSKSEGGGVAALRAKNELAQVTMNWLKSITITYGDMKDAPTPAHAKTLPHKSQHTGVDCLTHVHT